MWILSQDKKMLTNGKINLYYCKSDIGSTRYHICMCKEFDGGGISHLGTYKSYDEAKEAFDNLVKKINLYDCVVKID